MKSAGLFRGTPAVRSSTIPVQQSFPCPTVSFLLSLQSWSQGSPGLFDCSPLPVPSPPGPEPGKLPLWGRGSSILRVAIWSQEAAKSAPRGFKSTFLGSKRPPRAFQEAFKRSSAGIMRLRCNPKPFYIDFGLQKEPLGPQKYRKSFEKKEVFDKFTDLALN